MNDSVIQFGAQIAVEMRDSSVDGTLEVRNPETLRDILDILRRNPPPEFPMLKSTCALLAAYLEKPTEQIKVDAVYETKDGFRSYLVGRKNKSNSIRSYMNFRRILLKSAEEFGWKPDESVPEEWRGVLALSTERSVKCGALVRHLAGIRKTPGEVMIEDVDHWAEKQVHEGRSYFKTRAKRSRFWRILDDCGCTEQLPTCIVRKNNYGVNLEQFPSGLKKEVLGLLRWKQDEFVVDRPNAWRVRAVTAKRLQDIISRLLGYALHIRGESEITSLSQLMQKPIIRGYLEWSINERKVKGSGLLSCLRPLAAAMHQHPSYASMDLSWFKLLLDSLPAELKSEMKMRKARKCLAYGVVEAIPAKIRAQRPAVAKKGIRLVARLAMEELLIRWLLILPWRQRNLRTSRINGPAPNIFKAKILPYLDIDKPEWVVEEEAKNPEAEFWQFRFNPAETKTGISVNAVLPRPLIGHLEEYLSEFRKHLLTGADPGTLLVNGAGRAMNLGQMSYAVSALTLKYASRRATPHIFRDMVAFEWLKEHKRDYLTLSKILWHADINTTIRIYGSQFNESCGANAIGAWAEEREANSK